MKIKKHNKKIYKLVLILAAVLLVGIVAFFAYALAFQPQIDKSTDTSKPGNTSTDKQQSENPENSTDDKTKATNTDHPATPTTTEGSSKKQVQMVASTDQSNGTVYIRGGVNYPVTKGNCYAQLSGPSGQSIRKDSSILPNPSSTDCKTIAIPVSELTSGKWTFILNYTSDEFEGASSEVSFSI